MSSLRTCRACTRALFALPARPTASRTAVYTSISSQLQTTQTQTQTQAQRSYATPRPARTSKSGGLGTSFASKLREKAPIFTETYVAYNACDELIKECARPGAYSIPQANQKGAEIPTDEHGTHIGVGEGWWYETLGLKPTYLNWTQITFLHMWLLQVRFRMLPATHARTWIEHLTNHAFYAAEDRLVVYHKFTQASLRQKYLKDTFAQWRAVLLSYDEGLVKGDAVLAAAVWRNLLGAREDVEFDKLAQVVSYLRRELARLDQAGDDKVLNGEWKFVGHPGEEAAVVERTSPMARARR